MIELVGISKVYKRGAEEVYALVDVHLSIETGEFVAITGQSGSGKTTLLHIMGFMDTPTKGTIKIDNKPVDTHSDKEMTRLRREVFGFVFQHFYLIPSLSVYDNIRLPLMFSRKKLDLNYIDHLIDLVGLKGKERFLPSQLSGGQMQRVAIARAMVNRPTCILADEPTGNLDSQNSELIFETFKRLNSEGQTIVMVTHNNDLARRTQRLIVLRDGRIIKS